MRPDQKRDVIGPSEVAYALCVAPATIGRFLSFCRSPAVPPMATYVQGTAAKDYGTKAVEIPFASRFQARCCALYVALTRDGMGEAQAATNAWLALCGWADPLPETVFVRSGDGIGGVVRLAEPADWDVGFKPLSLDKVEHRLAYAFGVWGKTLAEWHAADAYHGVRLIPPEKPKLDPAVIAAAKVQATPEERKAAVAALQGIGTPYARPRRRVFELPDVDEAEPTREVGLTGRPTLAPVETGAAFQA